MSNEEFSAIVKKADLRAIAKAFKRAGYKNCKLNMTLRKVSLYKIVMGDYFETEYYADGKGNEFIGNLCRNVEGLEKYEFLLVEQLSPYRRDCDDLLTKKIIIYAKVI